MEVYEAESNEIVKRFLEHELNFPECIAALDAVLAAFIPRLTGDQIKRLRIVMLANNELVMKEMERRGPDHLNSLFRRIPASFDSAKGLA